MSLRKGFLSHDLSVRSSQNQGTGERIGSIRLRGHSIYLKEKSCIEYPATTGSWVRSPPPVPTENAIRHANAFEISDIEMMNIGAHQPRV